MPRTTAQISSQHSIQVSPPPASPRRGKNGKIAAMIAGAGLSALGQPALALWIVTETPGSVLDFDGEVLNLDIDGDATADFKFNFKEGKNYYGGSILPHKYAVEVLSTITGLNGGQLLGGGANMTPQQILNNYINGLQPPNLVTSKVIKDYYDCLSTFGGRSNCGFVNQTPRNSSFSGTLGLSFGAGSFGYVTINTGAGGTGDVAVPRFGLWQEDPVGPVPVPGTLSLLACGALGIAAMRRRRKELQPQAST